MLSTSVARKFMGHPPSSRWCPTPTAACGLPAGVVGLLLARCSLVQLASRNMYLHRSEATADRARAELCLHRRLLEPR